MKQGSAADFLIRTVLDETFRELALADPQRAFEEYDLSEEEKEILRVRDHRLLGLLGDAVAPKEAPAEPPLEKEQTGAVAPSLPGLPEVTLLLRLVPQVAPSSDSQPNVSYAASLHPWPCDEERITGPETAEGTEDRAGVAAEEVRWIIRIAPQVVASQDAGLTVAYAASIHPVTTDTDEARPPVVEPAPELASPPWNHHVESSAAKAAAEAVQNADPGKRFEKLLDLVHALQTGDEDG